MGCVSRSAARLWDSRKRGGFGVPPNRSFHKSPIPPLPLPKTPIPPFETDSPPSPSRSGIFVQNPNAGRSTAGPGGDLVRDLLRHAEECVFFSSSSSLRPCPVSHLLLPLTATHFPHMLVSSHMTHTADSLVFVFVGKALRRRRAATPDGGAAWGGGGHVLGGEGRASVFVPAAGGANTGEDKDDPADLAIRRLTFWHQGFTVEDGPLMRYDDPSMRMCLLRFIRGGSLLFFVSTFFLVPSLRRLCAFCLVTASVRLSPPPPTLATPLHFPIFCVFPLAHFLRRRSLQLYSHSLIHAFHSSPPSLLPFLSSFPSHSPSITPSFFRLPPSLLPLAFPFAIPSSPLFCFLPP
ncbi:hypothetical protein DFH06DRAFT_1350333 [Mycena polygramma]|nr:hypothetical protein DFH06DRAFT_1350333 [Mycena polygramma]